MSDSSNKYEIGYKKPPQKHQFKPGQSGNKKGRPKSAKGFQTDFMEELEEKITLKDGGEIKTMTKQRALIKRLIASALSGNSVSIKLVTSIMSSMPIKPDELEQDLTVDDAMVIQTYIGRKIEGVQNERR